MPLEASTRVNWETGVHTPVEFETFHFRYRSSHFIIVFNIIILNYAIRHNYIAWKKNPSVPALLHDPYSFPRCIRANWQMRYIGILTADVRKVDPPNFMYQSQVLAYSNISNVDSQINSYYLIPISTFIDNLGSSNSWFES